MLIKKLRTRDAYMRTGLSLTQVWLLPMEGRAIAEVNYDLLTIAVVGIVRFLTLC